IRARSSDAARSRDRYCARLVARSSLLVTVMGTAIRGQLRAPHGKPTWCARSITKSEEIRCDRCATMDRKISLPVAHGLTQVASQGSMRRPSPVRQTSQIGERSARSHAEEGRRVGVARRTTAQVSVCVVGGGPAGLLLALLLAKRGTEVVVLEAQRTF